MLATPLFSNRLSKYLFLFNQDTFKSFWTIFLNSIWIEILNVGNKTVKKLPARKTKKHQHAHFRYEKILNKTGCSEVIKKDKLNKSEKKNTAFA